jgi:hypothetical protein
VKKTRFSFFSALLKKNIPANLTNVPAISAVADHTLVPKEDGTVVAWGDTLKWMITSIIKVHICGQSLVNTISFPDLGGIVRRR